MIIYISTLYDDVKAHASMRTHIANYSLCGYASSKPASDGLLPVHPLVLNVPATLRASTSMRMMSSRTVREASDERCPPAASPRSSTGCGSGKGSSAPSGELPIPSPHPRILIPHDRTCARPAAVARNLRINSESANDPCSAQSWTLGHLRNRWGWNWSSGTWYPRPQPACTNEVTPYGESPEAIRPEARGHTARTHGHARAPTASRLHK